MEKVSERLKNKARKEGVEWDVYVMATLVATGMKETDAYYSVINKNSQSSDQYDMEQLRRIVSDHAYCTLVTSLTRQFKRVKKFNDENDIETFSGDDLMTKEDVAKELLNTARSMKAGSKERAEVMMKYADLLQMKKDEVKDEEKLVHFYLPLTCHNCELYIKKQKTEK